MGASVAGAAIVIVLVVTAVYFSKSRRGDPRLIGTWKSDANATIAQMRKTRPVTDEQDQKLRMLFGKMTITYTETTFTSELDGIVETHPYQVVSKDRDSVQVKYWSTLTNKDEQLSIRFVGNDTYWVAAGLVEECFQRVP